MKSSAKLPQFMSILLLVGLCFPLLRSGKSAENASQRTPVYRFYNSALRTHFYTASENERDFLLQDNPQYQLEGVAFFAYSSEIVDTSPVYRFYNNVTGDHFYTISEEEKNWLLQHDQQYHFEGIGFYAYAGATPGMSPVYRFFDDVTEGHFYTISETEKELVLKNMPQYQLEGIAFFAPVTSGSNWTRIYPGPVVETVFKGHNAARAYYVRQTNDGGYIVTGSTGIQTVYIYLLKVDSLGNIQWEKAFNSSLDEAGNSVQPTSDGGYVVCGTTYDDGIHGRIHVIKTDAEGNTSWETFLGGQYRNNCGEAIQAEDGSYIIVGTNDNFVASKQSAYMAKLNVNGQMIWERFLDGGQAQEYATSATIAPGGGFVMAGFLQQPSGDLLSSIHLVKAAPSGDIAWEKTISLNKMEKAWSIRTTADGGFIVEGTTGFVTPDIFTFLIKLDSAGESQWNQIYSQHYNEGSSVKQTKDNGFVMAGTSADGMYLRKTDSEGRFVWERSFKEMDINEGSSVDCTSDGGFIVAGWTGTTGNIKYGFIPDAWAYLVKTDSQGLAR